jgi:methylenetetrahydrofolate dehydrogenase (NADP+) / methenyltetrahydrofolate cyclohydrolase
LTQILKAAPVISQSLEQLKSECEKLKAQGITPSMKVILVGSNPPSVVYTRNKKIFTESFGGECEIIHLPETISKADFRQQLKLITQRDDIHGCFVQLPLPSQLQHIDVGSLIPPEIDVDGFHPNNLMKILKGTSQKALIPCTPKGILTLMEHYDIDPSGKNIVVIGRSMIVGKPMALLLTEKNATVTLCHSRTLNLEEHCQRADIIISAVGKTRFLNSKYVRHDQSQVLIDVGINVDDKGKLCGDMDFEDLLPHVKSITPVPGGVGKMTILSLAQNLLQAARNKL